MKRDPQINIRLPQDLKDDIQNMASDNKRSVNAEVVAALLEAVKHHKSGIDGSGLFRDKTAEEVSEILERVKYIEQKIKGS